MFHPISGIISMPRIGSPDMNNHKPQHKLTTNKDNIKQGQKQYTNVKYSILIFIIQYKNIISSTKVTMSAKSKDHNKRMLARIGR